MYGLDEEEMELLQRVFSSIEGLEEVIYIPSHSIRPAAPRKLRGGLR